jgi:hypothetical protein
MHRLRWLAFWSLLGITAALALPLELNDTSSPPKTLAGAGVAWLNAAGQALIASIANPLPVQVAGFGAANVNTGINGYAFANGNEDQVVLPQNLNRLMAVLVNPGTAAGQGIAGCSGAVIQGNNPTGTTVVRGIGYAPNGISTLAGGDFTLPCQLKVLTTGVSTSQMPAIVSAGSGLTDGSSVIFNCLGGTPSAGTRASLTVSVVGGVVTSVLGIYEPGAYIVNPSTTAETCQQIGGGGVSPTFSLAMGPRSVQAVGAGRYRGLLPTASTVMTESGSTSGGTGATYFASIGGAPETLYCSLGRAASLLALNTFELAPGQEKDIGPLPLVFTGDIHCLAPTGGHALDVTEFVKS